MSNLSYNLDDIVTALSKAGLQHGDTAYFSTSLGMIGIAEGIKNQNDLNSLFLEAIKKVLGPQGTILIPAYSYTFGGSTKSDPKVFDPLTTPTQVGPFPSFFLEQKDVIRTIDPMMSIAGLGISTVSLFKDLPPTSYGHDCLYARLVDHPTTKCVSIGLGPNWAPFLHHADWLSKVPYRYDKVFYGGIKLPAGIQYLDWTYCVRNLKDESWADAHELGKRATDVGIWKYEPLGRARIYVCQYKKFFDYTVELQRENKWLTARGPSDS